MRSPMPEKSCEIILRWRRACGILHFVLPSLIKGYACMV